MLIVGLVMTYLYPNSSLYYAHKAGGVLVLILVAISIFFQYIFGRRNISRFQSLMRYTFNTLTLLMPIAGILMILFKGGSIDIFGVIELKSFYKDLELARIARLTHKIVGIFFAILLAINVVKFFTKKLQGRAYNLKK